MGGHPDKRKRFVKEYLIDSNGAQAAIRAGYSPRSAKELACALLTKHHIKAEIARGQAEQQTHLGLTRERILNEIRRIAFADIGECLDENGELLNVKDMPEDVRKALASMKVLKTNMVSGDGAREQVVEVKLWDKTKALQLAAQVTGMLDQRIEHDVAIQVSWLPMEQAPIDVTPTQALSETSSDASKDTGI